MLSITALAVLTGLAAAAEPFATFDVAVYGESVEVGRNARIEGPSAQGGPAPGTGQVTVGTQNNRVDIGNGVVLTDQNGNQIVVGTDSVTMRDNRGQSVDVTTGSVRANTGSTGMNASVGTAPTQQGGRLVPAPSCPLGAGGSSYDLARSESARLTPGSYQSLRLRNSAMVSLAPGNYRFEEIELNNSGEVRLEGPVVIYLGRSLTVRNSGTLNFQGAPANCQVYQADPARVAEVDVLNSATVNAALCGPNLDVSVKNSALLNGAALGRRVRVSEEARVIYDPNLRQVAIRR